MQMINEITVENKNRNLFNKILYFLKKNRSVLNSGRLKKTIFLSVPVMGRVMTYSTKVVIHMEDMVVVPCGKLIYFCAKFAPTLDSLEYKGKTDYKDMALFTIRSIVDPHNSFFVTDTERGLVNDVGVTSSSSDDYIKSTVMYKELSEGLKRVGDVKIKTILKPGVVKRMNIRENIIPLASYYIRADIFSFSGVNCSAKSLVEKENLINKNCRTTILIANYWGSCDIKYDCGNTGITIDG